MPTGSLEDYLEKILLLSEYDNFIRITDIAQSLAVKKSSVVVAMNKLSEKELIHYEKYGKVRLTNKGLILAENIYTKHLILKRFFNFVLSIDEKRAESIACSIEHLIDNHEIEKVTDLTFYLEQIEAERHIISDLREFRSKLSGIYEDKVETGKSYLLCKRKVDDPKLIKEMIVKGVLIGEIFKIERENMTCFVITHHKKELEISTELMRNLLLKEIIREENK